jgi:hypothetical protein
VSLSPCSRHKSSLVMTANPISESPKQDAETGQKVMDNTAARAPKLPRSCPCEKPNSLVGSLQRCQPWMHAGRNRAETGRKLGNQNTTKHDAMFALFFCYLKPDVPHVFNQARLHLNSQTLDSKSSLPALVTQSPTPIRQSHSRLF